jgi:hypothetical protein
MASVWRFWYFREIAEFINCKASCACLSMIFEKSMNLKATPAWSNSYIER